MEGITTYESSYEYIKMLTKDLISGQPIAINFAKLDTESAGAIRKVLSETLSQRSTDVYNIIASNQNQLLH